MPASCHDGSGVTWAIVAAVADVLAEKVHAIARRECGIGSERTRRLSDLAGFSILALAVRSWLNAGDEGGDGLERPLDLRIPDLAVGHEADPCGGRG